jgi:hypothetical protein
MRGGPPGRREQKEEVIGVAVWRVVPATGGRDGMCNDMGDRVLISWRSDSFGAYGIDMDA